MRSALFWSGLNQWKNEMFVVLTLPTVSEKERSDAPSPNAELLLEQEEYSESSWKNSALGCDEWHKVQGVPLSVISVPKRSKSSRIAAPSWLCSSWCEMVDPEFPRLGSPFCSLFWDAGWRQGGEGRGCTATATMCHSAQGWQDQAAPAARGAGGHCRQHLLKSSISSALPADRG